MANLLYTYASILSLPTRELVHEANNLAADNLVTFVKESVPSEAGEEAYYLVIVSHPPAEHNVLQLAKTLNLLHTASS